MIKSSNKEGLELSEQVETYMSMAAQTRFKGEGGVVEHMKVELAEPTIKEVDQQLTDFMSEFCGPTIVQTATGHDSRDVARQRFVLGGCKLRGSGGDGTSRAERDSAIPSPA